MGTTLTTRISDELAAEIDRICEEEQLDKSAVTRRLLERAVSERRRETAFGRYERGEISLESLARTADLSLRETLAQLRECGIHFQYSAESLREDVGGR